VIDNEGVLRVLNFLYLLVASICGIFSEVIYQLLSGEAILSEKRNKMAQKLSCLSLINLLSFIICLLHVERTLFGLVIPDPKLGKSGNQSQDNCCLQH